MGYFVRLLYREISLKSEEQNNRTDKAFLMHILITHVYVCPKQVVLREKWHFSLLVKSACLTVSFVRGILPDSMISVILVPVIKDKDKAGKITSKDNYRPIALASLVSKVVEIIILYRLSGYLLTNPNQFGFKKKLGSDQCIYVLKT